MMKPIPPIQIDPGLASRHPKMAGEAAHDYANRLYAAGRTEYITKRSTQLRAAVHKVTAPPTQVNRAPAASAGVPAARPVGNAAAVRMLSARLPSLDDPSALVHPAEIMAAELAKLQSHASNAPDPQGIGAGSSNKMWDEVIDSGNANRRRSAGSMTIQR